VYEKLSNPDARLAVSTTIIYNYNYFFTDIETNCSNILLWPLQGLDEFNKVKYARALTTARQAKLRVSQECSILTYSDIQECIDSVNVQCDEGFEGITRMSHKLNLHTFIYHILLN